MPDYADLVLPEIKKRRIAAVQPMEDLVLPSYDGYGLANLPATISNWLGGPSLPLGPLAEVITAKFQKRYKRVVLLLVDALGYKMFLRSIQAGKADFWKELLRNAPLFPITSICPSTTATALTSIWSGSAPSQHAYIGYEMWVKELGITINTIFHTPVSYNGNAGSLAAARFDPTTFNKVETLGNLFKAAGIETHAYQPANIVGSGLSLMQLGGVNVHGYSSEAELWINLRNELNRKPANRKFIYAYWPLVDTLMHRYGPDDERTMQTFAQFSNTISTCLGEGLKNRAFQDTLFLLTADHGAVFQPYYEQYNIRNHPDLLKELILMPTCEVRLPFLYPKPGREEAVRAYFERVWPGSFTLITRNEALEAGIFGPKSNRPELADRIGDLIAICHKDAYLWWPDKVNTMKGRHGGLAEDEILVPLLGFSSDQAL